MHRPVPETARLSGAAGAVPAPAASPSPRSAWRWAPPALFPLVLVALFAAYLRLSQTYPENSD